MQMDWPYHAGAEVPSLDCYLQQRELYAVIHAEVLFMLESIFPAGAPQMNGVPSAPVVLLASTLAVIGGSRCPPCSHCRRAPVTGWVQ